jgi:hypothetical protein
VELERDPFDILAGRYPADSLATMRDHYYGALVPA